MPRPGHLVRKGGEEWAEKCYELLATEESIHTLIHKCMYTFIHIQTY